MGIGRKRKIGKIIYFTDDELNLIYSNMKKVNSTNFSQFVRNNLCYNFDKNVDINDIKLYLKNIKEGETNEK